MSKLYSYPEPQNNPSCVCTNPMQAFFCGTGHSLECHSGFNCSDARCSHLTSYGETAESVTPAPAWTVEIILPDKKMIPTIIFAPTSEMAEQAMKFWCRQNPNISRIFHELIFTIRPATVEDFTEFEKLKKEYER